MVICRGFLPVKHLPKLCHQTKRICISSICIRAVSSQIKTKNTAKLLHSLAANTNSHSHRPGSVLTMLARGMTSHPDITVSPSGPLLVDDELHIYIRGLGTSQNVTIHARIQEDGKKFESCCCVCADDNGVVDLHRQPSLSGTYTGISPMGLFWSLVPEPGQMDGIRLMKKNVDTPYCTHMNVYDGHLSLEDIRQVSPASITSCLVDRWYKGPDVTCVEIREGRVRGKLFLPSGPGPFPGVIDMFGTVGGLVEYRAALLASRGYATLALAYFLYDDLPTNMLELDLEYFLEAIDWLSSHRKVVPGGIGAIGVSKGGDMALLMGAYSSKVRAIVNINGCTFNAMIPLKYDGVQGGVIPPVEFDWNKMEQHGAYWSMDKTLDYRVEDLTPVWKNEAKILNILSEDDYCNPKECIRLMKERFPEDKTDNFIIVEYPDAGHLVEPPYTPLCRMSYHKSFSMYMLWGGFPEPHAYAQQDSWRRILEHFHTHLSPWRPASKL